MSLGRPFVVYNTFMFDPDEPPMFRPPAEADSAIVRVAYGCPHAACAFWLP